MHGRLWLTVTLLVLTVTAPAWAKPRLIMGSFRAPTLKTSLQGFLTEHLAQQLQKQGLTVISARDITEILGLERQRQLLGCEESTNCQAELVGALGADGIVLGDVEDLEGALHVNVKVISTASVAPLATFSTKVAKRGQLPEAMERAAVDLAHELLAPVVPPPPPRPPPKADPPKVVSPLEPPAPVAVAQASGGGSRVPAVAVATGAVLLLAAGTTLAFLAKANHDALSLRGRDVPLSTDSALALANRGATFEAFSVGSFAVGGAAAVVATVWFLLSKPALVTASIAPTPNGAVVVIGAPFP